MLRSDYVRLPPRAKVEGRTHRDDGKSLSEHSGEGDGSFRADEAVAEVDHLHVPQVPQGLRGSPIMIGIDLPVFQCVKQGLTCAMASIPFFVNVLSLKLRTRSCGL